MHFRIAVIHHAPDFALITFDFNGAAVNKKLAAVESADTGPTRVRAAAHCQQG
jgi:hypothetical protein